MQKKNVLAPKCCASHAKRKVPDPKHCKWHAEWKVPEFQLPNAANNMENKHSQE
jgi:hypothetical protein